MHFSVTGSILPSFRYMVTVAFATLTHEQPVGTNTGNESDQPYYD